MHGTIRSLGYFLIASPFLAIAIIGYALGGWLGIVVPFGSAGLVVATLFAGFWLLEIGKA